MVEKTHITIVIPLVLTLMKKDVLLKETCQQSKLYRSMSVFVIVEVVMVIMVMFDHHMFMPDGGLQYY